MKLPYVIYADFESIIEKYDTCIPPPETSSTTKTGVHKPCGFSLVARRSESEFKEAGYYRGEDCASQFLATLLQMERGIREELAQKKELIMTEKDWKEFNKAKECHVCKKDFIRRNEKDETEVWEPETVEYLYKAHKYKKSPVKSNKPVSCHREIMELISTDENDKSIEKWHKRDYKSKEKAQKENPDENNCFLCKEPLLREEFRDAVKDHCHITGKFRGAAHNACNLKLRINPETVVIPYTT